MSAVRRPTPPLAATKDCRHCSLPNPPEAAVRRPRHPSLCASDPPRKESPEPTVALEQNLSTHSAAAMNVLRARSEWIRWTVATTTRARTPRSWLCRPNRHYPPAPPPGTIPPIRRYPARQRAHQHAPQIAVLLSASRCSRIRSCAYPCSRAGPEPSNRAVSTRLPQLGSYCTNSAIHSADSRRRQPSSGCRCKLRLRRSASGYDTRRAGPSSSKACAQPNSRSVASLSSPRYRCATSPPHAGSPFIADTRCAAAVTISLY